MAQNNLIIRDRPSIYGGEIISIEYGSVVTVLADYCKQDVVDGKSGWWLYICYNGQYYGYIRDGYIERL